MKKLNKKGFTLVELLAVIVILAVIMVITIPTVLGSMSSAKDSAAQNAIAAIQKYIDDQEGLCKAGLGDMAPYERDLFTSDCVVNTANSDLVTTILNNSGYSKEFKGITFETKTIAAGTCTAIGTHTLDTTTEEYCDLDGDPVTNDGYRTKAIPNVVTNKIASVTVTTGSQFGNDDDEITAK